MQIPLFRLRCGVNSYAWGKKGYDSIAARFAVTTAPDNVKVEDDIPYAELWMGTHPLNPSRDFETGRPLLDVLEGNQTLLSQAVVDQYGIKLPFLLKVLSIAKPLSIQAHPDKKLAQRLHARNPQNYPDDKHKPEMAIAITPFEGLCGFRPLAEIVHFLNTVPALRALVGNNTAREFAQAAQAAEAGLSDEKHKTLLKRIFAELMSSSEEDIAKNLSQLIEQVDREGADFAGGGVPATSGEKLAELVKSTNSDFGDDIGCFILFFLNYVTLEPGECLVLAANEIHSYISGDIIECMAASDNVVRAGLTSKYKDTATLVDMLTYSFVPTKEQKISPQECPRATVHQGACGFGSTVILYRPPFEEFAVVRALLLDEGAKVTFEPLNGPSIIICTSGSGKITVGTINATVAEGCVFFVGANVECVLAAKGDQGDRFATFRAFCEIECLGKQSP